MVLLGVAMAVLRAVMGAGAATEVHRGAATAEEGTAEAATAAAGTGTRAMTTGSGGTAAKGYGGVCESLCLLLRTSAQLAERSWMSSVTMRWFALAKETALSDTT